MDGSRFDALVRAASSRRGLLGSIGIGIGAAKIGAIIPADAKKRRRKKRNRRGGARHYPVFTTCYTDEGEVGAIPDGPHPTCQSLYDPDEFAPCNPEWTLDELKIMCDEAYPECQNNCRILAEPIVGLGDCPNFDVCALPGGDGTEFEPLPGGPYASCWSWPDGKCETCPGRTPDYQGLKNLCATTYPGRAPNGCIGAFNRNLCYPWANCIPDC
jgi:hypothetical protein